MLKYVYIASNSLLRHKLRSGLSVLGIIFGVGSVIVALAIGEGARREFTETIELLGINNITVRSLSHEKGKVTAAGSRGNGLSVADLGRIERKLKPYLAGLAPLAYRAGQVAYKSNSMAARIVGTGPAYQKIYDLEVDHGRFLVDVDLDQKQRVCVLGKKVKQALFPLQDPLGKMIRSGNEWFRVVGWLHKKAMPDIKNNVLKVADLNLDIYIPFTTAFLSMAGEENLAEIAVKSLDKTGLPELAATINRIMVQAGENQEDFEVVIPGELLRQSQRLRRIFNSVMAGIAAISLLVGGIGIMNIMLATVSERTREIGIRRALGASRREITWQFLAETVLLAWVGGLAGICLGIIAAFLVGHGLGWRVGVSLSMIVLAGSISMGVGIVFGLYPARRAAMLDPVAALRHE